MHWISLTLDLWKYSKSVFFQMCFVPGPWFNITLSSYQYRKSHNGDKTILWPSYLHNGISYTGKITLYWIRAKLVMCILQCYFTGTTAIIKLIYWELYITKQAYVKQWRILHEINCILHAAWHLTRPLLPAFQTVWIICGTRVNVWCKINAYRI